MKWSAAFLGNDLQYPSRHAGFGVSYHEKRTCPPQEKAHRATTFERWLSEAMARKPGVSRDEFLSALAQRYAEFRRKRL
ncbi:MAG TPA: hypothetical protein P5525_13810 [Candidatus Paceibacterota bacterium]|nr:hypothetical protein [Candidatus Paceibacterota bacterium]